MYIPEEESNTEETVELDENLEVEDGDAGVEVAEEEETDESDDEAEPSDLAEAFGRLREMDTENSSDDVGSGDDAEEGDEESDDGEGEYLAADDEGDYADGGSTEYADPTEYQATSQAIVAELNRNAVAQARKQFADQGIREFTMNDLYERTQDGRVVYHNPDDPNRPFASRMEAQQWIDSFNSQVQQELKKTALDIRNETAKAAMPALRLMEFAPTYDAMDDGTKQVFDDLIEDYEVKNRAGKVIGYSCDLNRMAAKAERLSAKYNHTPSKSGKVSKKASSKSPALDTRSHGSSLRATNDGEPQTLEEAMKRLRENRR